MKGSACLILTGGKSCSSGTQKS